MELDTIDIKILRILQTEGRIRSVELAERVGLSPTPWNRKRVWMTSNDSIEVTLALVVENCEAFVFGLAHVPKPPRHRHGVAVVTTARSSRAACDWVPSRICPFNSAHLTPPQSILKT